MKTQTRANGRNLATLTVLLAIFVAFAGAAATSMNVTIVPTIIGATQAQTNMSVQLWQPLAPVYGNFGYAWYGQGDSMGIRTAELWSVSYLSNGWYVLFNPRWQ